MVAVPFLITISAQDGPDQDIARGIAPAMRQLISDVQRFREP